MPRSHYDVLQLDSSKATHDEIKRAFRRLSMDLHPDKNGNSEESKRAFQELNEAYTVLSDPQKRGNYDFELQMGNRIPGHMHMHNMGPMGMGVNPLDMLFAAMHQSQHQQQQQQQQHQPHNPAQHIFEAMFGGNGLGMGGMGMGGMGMGGMGMGGMGMGPQIIIHNFTASPNTTHPTPHSDENECDECDHIEMVVISLSDAYNGFTQRPINVSYHDDNYNKQTDIVLIDVPPRVANGHKMHLKRHGTRPAMTIQINIAEHPVFIREGGDDLLVEHRVSLKDALCGFTFELTHLSGRSYKFNCKSCSITSVNETKVMPGLGYNETGALKIRFSIAFPAALTEEQISALSSVL
jgi:DnaJ-class molecular chaperone